MIWQDVIRRAGCIGFSGSRRLTLELNVPLLSALVYAKKTALDRVRASDPDPDLSRWMRFAVGSAPSDHGSVDAYARSKLEGWPNVKIFASLDRRPHNLVRRSSNLAFYVVPDGGVLIALPLGKCPAGLVPDQRIGQCFRGDGTGTWSTAALARGNGARLLVFCPSAVPPGWGLVPAGDGWYLGDDEPAHEGP